MDNPQQTLLHLTSRGTKVRAQAPGAAGRFTNQVGQPMNNINKFGLLHYSIPKTLDFMDQSNRTFGIKVTYRDGNSVEIPVTLPLMDFYNMKVDTMSTTGVCFTEVLQTSINWAIQKEWTRNHAANMDANLPLQPQGKCVSNRLGCVVKMTKDKRLQFLFGYRGSRTVGYGVMANYPTHWTGTVHANTGAPLPVVADPASPARNFPGIDVGATNVYQWIDTIGAQRNHQPWGGNIPNHVIMQFQLKTVAFYNMSSRLQLLFGIDAPAVETKHTHRETWVDGNTAVKTTADALLVQRGRMVLASYHVAAAYRYGVYSRTGILEMSMPIQPNMFPPSFMFLQLTAQGTKTKVLGHSAERGGWSVPCAANQFKSKYDNFPKVQKMGTFAYDVDQARNIPALMNAQSAAASGHFYLEKAYKQEPDPAGGGANIIVENGDLPQSSRFDQIPYNPGGDVTGGYTELNNFSTAIMPMANNAGAATTNHRFGSRMIHYGDLTNQECLAHKNPREDKQFGMDMVVEAPTFTVSMIDPNWIYTDVPNSTLQSLSCLLMWGDTSENVEDTCANPVQFSMIASQ